MPNSVWPRHEDAPVIGDEPLAALLAGAELPPGSGPELRSLAEALAGLRGRAASGELAGEAEALAAFRNQFGAPGTVPRHRARRSSPRFRRLPVRAAAAATVTVLGLGGLATASYAGALPASLQRFAHDVIGAPASGTRPVMSPSWAVPGASHRPYGLCVAWAHARAHGTRKQQATAFRELAAAAGGRGNVTAYCATAAHPGTSPPTRPQPDPTPHGHGKPTGLPSPHGTGKPSGLPSPHGHGKPTGLPSPHGTGKPSGLPTPHATGKPSALPTPHSTGR
jgi:hypothetical protein